MRTGSDDGESTVSQWSDNCGCPLSEPGAPCPGTRFGSLQVDARDMLHSLCLKTWGVL